MSPHPRYLTFLLLSFIIFSLYQFPCRITPLSERSQNSEGKTKPVHVLVVSSWRSGSSFLGQIFNHHSDVFYLFEPGHSLWMKFRDQSAELLDFPLRDLLRSLFTCDVSPLRQYLSRGGKYMSEIGFFAESRALCSPPACPSFVPPEGYDRLKCHYRCQRAPLDRLVETCRTYSHVVMKTVRVLDLSVLLPLFRDPDLDLRILHLVRDPRAVSLSRKLFYLNIEDHIVLKKEGNQNITISRAMEKICRAQVNINNVAKAAKELEGRYMVVRHEDLAAQPFKNIKNIYRFAGLGITKDLEQWVYNITHQEVPEKNGIMTFSRNSTMVVQKWRTQLPFSYVKEIQGKCREAMERFGYRVARSQKEQRKLSTDLVNWDGSLKGTLLGYSVYPPEPPQ